MKSRLIFTGIITLSAGLALWAQDMIYGPEDPPPKDYTLTYNGSLNDAEIGLAQGKTLYLSQFGLAATTNVYYATVTDEVKISMDGESWSPNEILQFDSISSNLANGVLVWTGTTNIIENGSTIYTKFTLVATEQGTGDPIPLEDPKPITGNTYAGGIIHISETLAFQVNLRFDAGYSQASMQPALDFYNQESFGNTSFSSYDYGIFWKNDPPQIEQVVTLSVLEGDTAWLSADNLVVVDTESSDAEIQITLATGDPSLPLHGTLYSEHVALAGGDAFTLDQLKSGVVYYVHDDSETKTDSLGFLISDGDGKYYYNAKGDSTVVFIPVAITPVDDAPVITILELFQPTEGEEAAITSLFLKTEDNESDAAHVTYTFDPDLAGTWPTAGIIKLSGLQLNKGDQFTQADIDLGNLSYYNFGTETVADGFVFTVEDETGNHAVGDDEQENVFFEIAVSLVNDPPFLKVNSPTEVNQWSETFLDENHLAASDEESDAAHISFTLEPGVLVTDFGSLYLGETALAPEDVFTMQDILDRKVRYVNNGSPVSSDGIVIKISDEQGAFASDAGFSTFTHMFNVTLTALEPYEPDAVSIYPNPTQNLLNIEIQQPGQFSIVITNLNGQQLYSVTLDETVNRIDLSSFQKGVYFITIRSKDYIVTEKILKSQ